MFKIGDRVVCVDVEGNNADRHLEVGKEYIVVVEPTTDDATMCLEGVYHEWKDSRFVLASEYNKVEAVEEGYAQEVVKPIKSDGGSSACYFLNKALQLQKERGEQYDSDEVGERSMGKTVVAFNAITGNTLTESEGWLLLQLLKDVRQWAKITYHPDSAEDCVSYAALKAEALSNGR